MSVVKYFTSKSKHLLGKLLRQQHYNFDPDVQDIVVDIRKSGFYMLPNFYSKEYCQKLIDEVDKVIDIRTKSKSLWEDSFSSDKRCFAAEDDSEVISEFYNNKYLQSVADNFFRAKMSCSNTLAGRIQFMEGNIGSGQGWHRDGNHLGFKAMVYLTDVEIQDGPFQLLIGSHKIKSILKNININKYDGVKLRFDNQEVSALIHSEVNQIKTFTAKAGTVILFDTSTLHSGSPLREGGLRYALTNYYCASYEDVAARKEMYRNAYKKQRSIK